MNWTEIATFAVISTLAAVAPGADLAMILRQSIVYGRRNAIVSAFGIGTALMVHTTYTVLGLGLIISQSIVFFNIIKWCGVAYLLYIGFKSLMAKGTTIALSDVKQNNANSQQLKRAFMLGFAVNVLNPKAVFFFLSIFSTLVAVTTPVEIKYAYGLLMAVIVVVWFVCVSLFMTAPVMRRIFSRASKWVDRLSGVVFIGLGIRLMFQKAS